MYFQCLKKVVPEEEEESDENDAGSGWIREATPQSLHHFTRFDQVNQLVGASEADPDLGFMARVIAFYSLAASSVERRRVSSRVGRNMPEPIPVILLGQLAVDTDYQGRGLGSDLLIDAGKRALTAADVIGARAIVVQAFDEDAKKFYAPFGFLPFSDREPLMLILRISELRVALQS